ncbi:sorbosone dehydrogenase family protein [Roseomonas sp. SSH11]|uniref:Sorbosone dehydrogenase family protein n=1 Tax=Pararoseomonas baculiformis TaxID=2820812 RepID=A0ABS4AGU8_9PROT|nr:sorbosone dehydrogenase family protein [Pararoseomonas baculiformis]MBP0446252.1 sorbosone dehydrogenase family protein [Pararoseomonas baculiformis]
MTLSRRSLLLAALASSPALAQQGPAELPGMGTDPRLPPPDMSHEVTKHPRAIGWPEGRMPRAAEGFAVTRFAGGLENPRWLEVLPNGDVLVAEAATKPKPAETEEERRKQEEQRRSGTVRESADRITLLRDADGDGLAETRSVLLEGLNQPFGMAVIGERLFVANTGGVMRFPFRPGQQRIEGRGEKILELPAGGYNNHWTRTLRATPDGSHLLIAVGSASNAGEYGMEQEHRRAAILRVDLDGRNEEIHASGLRNPVGLGFEPRSGQLWAAVNERDKIGDDLVPDYITRVQQGAFYGWPYSYFGQHEDPRMAGKAPELVARAVVPDYALGPHTASLGLAFYTGDAFPQGWREGAFIGQRGSWNRSTYSGYRVVFVPFENGRPNGQARDFLTGFMADAGTGEVYGRPVGVAVDGRGALLVADDTGNTVWRVAAARR